MGEIGEEFYLYWDRDILQGWQNNTSSLLVASMIEGVRLGHQFPAVDVVEVGDNFYRLACGRMDSRPDMLSYYDGGHHRAVAHYIEGCPLRCVPLENSVAFPFEFRYIDSSEVREGVTDLKLVDSLGRLPREIAEKFCNDNYLDFERYLSQ
jgi:hypothetical protein